MKPLRREAIEVLNGLCDWEAGQGGFEAAAWKRARSLRNRLMDEEEKGLPHNYVAVLRVGPAFDANHALVFINGEAVHYYTNRGGEGLTTEAAERLVEVGIAATDPRYGRLEDDDWSWPDVIALLNPEEKERLGLWPESGRPAMDWWTEEDADHPKSDWRYEVANGDTLLGYESWTRHRKEGA